MHARRITEGRALPFREEAGGSNPSQNAIRQILDRITLCKNETILTIT